MGEMGGEEWGGVGCVRWVGRSRVSGEEWGEWGGVGWVERGGEEWGGVGWVRWTKWPVSVALAYLRLDVYLGTVSL